MVEKVTGPKKPHASVQKCLTSLTEVKVRHGARTYESHDLLSRGVEELQYEYDWIVESGSMTMG